MSKALLILALFAPAAALAAPLPACPQDPALIKQLDTEYQAAVEKSDAAAMARLLADDFTLVTGKGQVYGKKDLLDQAHDTSLRYEHQSDTRQSVRFYGEGTAVITALLYIKAAYKGDALDFDLWFSDVYTCTPKGWIYSFGQAGAHVPHAS